MSSPGQGKIAIDLPVRIIGYAPLQDGVKYGEELATYCYKDMHFGFAYFHPSLEIGSISGHGSYGNYREHPNNPANILIASMAHSGMLQPIVATLEASRAPAKMGEEMFQGGKAMNILNFRDEGCQRRDITYGKVFRLIGQPAKKVSYLLLHSLNSCCQSRNSFPQDR